MLNKRTLEIIEETGKLPVSGIEDLGTFQAELKAAGYTSSIDASTDYLIVEKELVIPEGLVIFDNGGGATLQLGKFAHYYQDMSQSAEDVAVYLKDGNTDGWDGYEEDAAELNPSYEDIRNGGYRVYCLDDIIEESKNDDCTGWGNINDFCVALAEKMGW